MKNKKISTLKLTGISRFYGSRKVLDELNLEVESGQVVCLLGPSGCGKSTTLRIAAGVEFQDLGKIFLHEDLISQANKFHLPSEARNIGLIFQDFALFPHFTVLENVLFGLKRKIEKKNAVFRATDLLERFKLSAHADKYPHMLSGGEQQRVALARAMAPMPKVMLMDEPFSGLDNRLRDGVRDETLTLLKEEGTAILMVTHDPDEAMKISDKIALMRDGKIIQEGAPYNIYNKPVDSSSASFFSDVNILSGTVKHSQIDTSFGLFITPGLQDGTNVNILIRPQHLKIDFDRNGKGPDPTVQDGVPARGLVKRSRFVGKESQVELIMETDSKVLKATIPGAFLPSVGTPLWLSMRRDRCFVFAE